MAFHYKVLILVMVITSIMFLLAKPLFSQFIAPEDFARRRNLWLALTLAAFLLPNFWLFILVAVPMIALTASRDSNPIGLYLFLLLALPPIRLSIPGFGLVNQIFGLDHLRLLSLILLIPLVAKVHREQGATAIDGRRKWQAPDILLLLYLMAQVVLMFPYQSITSATRQIVLLVLDAWLPYYVVSRACRSREMMVDALAAFALTMTVLAPLAVVEFVRGWLLYAGLQQHWGAPHMIGNLTRGDFLRAQATGGHSIVFGYAMAVAIGFWLYLQTRVVSAGLRRLALMTLLVGLVVALARGPWLGAAVIFLLFLAMGPRAAASMFKVLALLVVAGGVAFAAGYGDKIIESLPFVGSFDATVDYRQRLLETSWMLIQQNPIFGSPFYMSQMEDLRQGEGIIDIVNTYAGIALTFGLVGLGLFAAFFAVVTWRCFAAARQLREVDPDFSLLGNCLVACIGGVLVMIATSSNYLSIPFIYWSLAGLAVSYSYLAKNRDGVDLEAESGAAITRPWGATLAR
jgi:O-antigen ligase